MKYKTAQTRVRTEITPRKNVMWDRNVYCTFIGGRSTEN